MKTGRIFLALTAAIVLCSCSSGVKPFVFVHMTDTQTGFYDNSEGYIHSDSLMAAAVQAVNALRPEFAVVTGDLVDNVDDPLQNAIFEKRMSELEVPYYLLPGNHDYRKQWTKDIRDAYVALRGSERFSFMKNGCAFIGIDSNCIKEKAEEAENEQLEWLKGELAKARKAKYTFIFLHCPIFKKDIDEPEDYENFPMDRRREYVSLFKEAGVDAVLTGHTHKDYDTEYEGIRFIAANPVCEPLGHGRSGFNAVSVGKDGFEVRFVSTTKAPWGDYVVACGDKDLYIVDAAASVGETPEILWHWNVDEAKGQIPDEYVHYAHVLDDCKPVDGGKHLLLTSSGGGTLLLDIATRKVLFHARTPMSHSADMLPGGRLAVANSTHVQGNSLELYDVSRPDACVWKDTLYSGHGVYWSEKHNRLFVLGFKELRKYSLKDWETAKPSLVLENTYDLPSEGGHELSPAGEDGLIVTNHAGVFLFDIASGTFSPFAPLEGKPHVKSVNYDPASGKIVYTLGETSWWSNHVHILNPDKTLTFDPAFRLYKVRVLPDWKSLKAKMAQPPFPGFDVDPSLRAKGTNLRIFDDNIWQYDRETLPDAWVPLGIDCRDSVRSIGFAKMVADHKPDIVTLQEYSSHMDGHLAPKLRELGFTNACEQDGTWNFTPIFYDGDVVELLKVRYNLYTPQTYSNANTKSFTSAVFRHKATGRVFAVLNTHLWWKPDETQPGSEMARASQIRLMMAESDAIKAEYGCTVFLMGDMNCEEDTVPIRQLLDGGYIPCYKAATVFGDNHNGHHRCDPGGFSAESSRKGPDRATGALDHFFIHNAAEGVEVLVYYCMMDAYTLPLTDHYPNFVDVRL